MLHQKLDWGVPLLNQPKHKSAPGDLCHWCWSGHGLGKPLNGSPQATSASQASCETANPAGRALPERSDGNLLSWVEAEHCSPADSVNQKILHGEGSSLSWGFLFMVIPIHTLLGTTNHYDSSMHANIERILVSIKFCWVHYKYLAIFRA